MSPGLIIIIIIIVIVTLIVKKTKRNTTVFTNVSTPIRQSAPTQPTADTLTMPQKYASMGLLFFFYGFCHDTQHAQEAIKIIENVANVLCIAKEDALEYCNLYLDDDSELMAQLKFINSSYWRTYIMRECYKLVQMAPDTKPLFFAMANEIKVSLNDVTNF